MPWDTEDYPPSWKNLDASVRAKAIEVGNALLADGMEEGRAIPIALSQARKSLGTTEDRDQWVVPHDDGWAVRSEHAERARRVFETQSEAIEEAVAYARRHDAAVTVLRQDGTIRDRQSFRSRL